MNREHMKQFVESNPDLVTMKDQGNGLFVLKYKSRVFYDNLWTPELELCRGTVVDSNFNVVQLPFTKIYNLNENGMFIEHDETVTSVRKVNGFMAALTTYNGFPLVSTTGSLHSDFAQLATEVLSQDAPAAFALSRRLGSAVTFLFEIVDPSDPHIVKDEPGAYLLNARCTDWNAPECMYTQKMLDFLGDIYRIRRPEWKRAPMGEVIADAKTCKHEGFVVYGANTTLKIKSPYYLVTKMLARMRTDRLINMITKAPETLRQRIDEEYYPLIDHVAANLDMFSALPEQDRISHIEDFFTTRLEQ